MCNEKQIALLSYEIAVLASTLDTIRTLVDEGCVVEEGVCELHTQVDSAMTLVISILEQVLFPAKET